MGNYTRRENKCAKQRKKWLGAKDTGGIRMQNGYRWVIREKNSGKWLKSVMEASIDGLTLSDNLNDALRYAAKFRATDDANYLTSSAQKKKSTITGMLFEVYEFGDSDRDKQTEPYLVFTPKIKEKAADKEVSV